MKVDMPLGDIVDKVTILQIKLERLPSPGARANVRRELRTLIDTWHDHELPELDGLDAFPDLAEVNLALWEVEDRLREHEARGDFGDSFVALARRVYRLNDKRAALKRQINDQLGSAYVEEKSYADWKSAIDDDP